MMGVTGGGQAQNDWRLPFEWMATMGNFLYLKYDDTHQSKPFPLPPFAPSALLLRTALQIYVYAPRVVYTHL